jgi:hypothetical protein
MGHRCWHSGFLLVLTSLLLMTGCTGTSTREFPVTGIIPVILPSPIVRLTSIPAVTSVATEPLHLITEPLATATRLRFDTWSPDGRWMAYWQGESEDLPAHLVFIDTHSGKVCRHEELTSGFWDGYAIWQDDGRVLAMLNRNKDVFRGTPCGVFDPVRDYALPEEGGDVSSDGRYRADTVARTEEQLIHNVTTITELRTGKTVAHVAWDASVHALQSGPRWLNDELYLLGQTLNQGVLYIEPPYGRTGDVLTDLFGLGAQYDKSIWHVFSYTDPVAGTYHILLQWDGGPVRSPILLYHSELKKVEELAFYEVHPFSATDHEPLDFFSPEGKWLLVSDPLNEEHPPNAIGEDYWLQPVDPPGSEAVKIATGLAAGKTSWAAQKMAFYDRQAIYIFNLPDGELLGRWAASRFTLIPAAGRPTESGWRCWVCQCPTVARHCS